MMNNNENKNIEVIESQEQESNLNSSLTLEEQNKEAIALEKNAMEVDKLRTVLCAERVLQRLVDEEGFVIGERQEEVEAREKERREQETVKEDLQRRYNEYIFSWKNSNTRAIKTKKIGSVLGAFFRTFILIGLCFVILSPVIEKMSYAFRAPRDISNPQVVWIPETWSSMNIKVAFGYLTLKKDVSFQGISFIYNISTFANTIILSAVTTLIQVIATAIAGYSFARLKFKGNTIIFLLVLLTLIVPQESLQTARSLLFSSTPFFGINLISNAFAIYLMSAFGMGLRSAIFIYLFRQFFRGVPVELEESAEIDGAGVIRTFWSVMLPNARGAIVTVALFSFVWQYNDYYWAMLYKYNDEKVMPLLTTALASSAETFNSLFSTSFQSLIAELGQGITQNARFYSLILNTAALLMMSPLIFGYLFVQKLFVESIERTGITGM